MTLTMRREPDTTATQTDGTVVTIRNYYVLATAWHGALAIHVNGIATVRVAVEMLPGAAYWRVPDSKTLRTLARSYAREVIGAELVGARSEWDYSRGWSYTYPTTNTTNTNTTR